MTLKYFGNDEKHSVPAGRGRRLIYAMALVFAAAPAGAGPLDVGLDVDIGGGGIGVDADVGIGGSGVGVDVDVAVGGGGGVSGPGVPGGPGVTPGTGVVAKATAGSSGGWSCARDTNETAYNGFVVRDRSGDAIGWVHGATVSPEGKVIAVRLQSSSSACYKLTGAGFRISGSEVWANVDASAFR